MKHLIVVAALVMMSIGPANASGFSVKDLTSLGSGPIVLDEKKFDRRVRPERLTLLCADCVDFIAVDILLGHSDDGTERRFRSGETKLEDLEAQCRSRDEECILEKIEIGSAIGWYSTYSHGSTAILFQEGDTLTIRGIASTSKQAASFVKTAIQQFASKIIGR